MQNQKSKTKTKKVKSNLRVEWWLSGSRGGGNEEILVKRYKFIVIRSSNSDNLLYNTNNIVKNTILYN